MPARAHDKRPLVLVTGGVGITPAMSMLEAVEDTGRLIRFIHAARHGGVHAFRDVDLYFLGPKPFMQSVYANGLALGVPAQRLRYEFFGPLEALEAA